MDVTQRGQKDIEWCIVKLDANYVWWVEEANWLPDVMDEDQLSILDPRQVEHIFDLLEPLREFGLRQEVVERAFLRFSIDKDLGGGRVRLMATSDEISDTDEKLFALPNIFVESYGGYAEFLDHISALRIKHLNDHHHFSQMLTVDELEEEVRETLESARGGDMPAHLFDEVSGILEYCPAGFSEDSDEEENEIDKDESDHWAGE